MSRWLWEIIIAGILIVAGAVVYVVSILVKDKRKEDAAQRQRERQNDEMWARIDARVKEHEDSA